MDKRRGYFFQKNKRGISTVIATMMIILLVLVAVGIIWVVIRNVISGGAGEINIEKFSFNLDIRSASLDTQGGVGVVKVTLHRNAGGENLIGIQFIFSDGSGSYSIERKTPIAETQEKVFTFTYTEIGNTSSLREVSIAPIYEVSGNDKIGNILDVQDIGRSSGGGGGGGGGSAVCGDGSIGSGEQCEPGPPLMLNGQTCSSQGFPGGGSLGCDSVTCQFDTSQCVGATPASCNGTWSPPEDTGVVCDGGVHCAATCVCDAGFTADGSGGCTLDPPINTGTVFSVWPAGAVKYFDSQNLPVDVSGYTNYYVNFSNSAENGCFRITFAEYLDLNGRSYLRTAFAVNIAATNNYHVWAAVNCGA